MSVKDRLKRLTGEGGPPTDSVPRSEIIGELRKRIDAVMARRATYPQKTVTRLTRPIRDLREVITGEEVSNAFGTCFFCRSAFLSRSYHGSREISRFALADMGAASLLAGHPEIGDMALTDALFLDTETTGLSGGTGTFAFLIGLGWFEGEDFIVCQLFSRDYHEEASMLALLAEMAREKRFLVTFNGRGFDLTLLAARYVLNRLEDPLAAMPHLDLLFPSRRLLGHRLENSRLVTLESRILGFTRTGDVPGYEIPKRYFDWLKSRDASLLEDVFLHNRLDVVSMAALVSHLSDLLTGGGSRQDLHPGDLLAAAKLHLGRGRYESARVILEALTASPHLPVAREAGITLSLAYKRQGMWAEAVKIWGEMAAADPEDLFAGEELAKWFEHHAHDYSRAIDAVIRLLAGRRPLSAEEKERLSRRLARLRRKAGIRRREVVPES